ncbi:MAG: hypothetical protein ABEJ94_03610 [Halorientalis sp.]
MSHSEAADEEDTLGRVFGLQRTAIREGRLAVWDGFVFLRRIDDAVRAGARAESATREAAVELCADTLRDGADQLDDALPGGPADGSGTVRALVQRPLDALVTANAAAGERFVAGLDAGLDRYERAIKDALLALNRRLSTLLDRHEELERRLREYVESLDDDERAEQVAEFRRQLSSLQADLRTMNAQLVGYDAAVG